MNVNGFKKVEPINKGISGDKKYCVETDNGERLLLRVADMAEYDHKKVEFERMQLTAAHGIPMPRPVDFGICDEDGI